MQNIKVYVIVVTYNAEKWVDFCLGSIRNSSIFLNTIVVDNNSQDKTIEMIKYNYPEIILIQSDSNLGFGKANNIGIIYALEQNCDYVFLLNQDACIFPDTLEKLIDMHLLYEDYGILSPIHLDGTGELIDTNFLRYISVNQARIISDKLIKGYNNNSPYVVPFINAAAWLISRKCILKVGGFDPLFPHYGEDDDYIRRVINKNFKVGVCANSFIKHSRNQFPLNVNSLTRTYISFLVMIKSSEDNYIKCFFQTQKRILIDILKSFAKLQFKSAFRLVEISIKLFKVYDQIRNHLLQEKSISPNYLY